MIKYEDKKEIEEIAESKFNYKIMWLGIKIFIYVVIWLLGVLFGWLLKCFS